MILQIKHILYLLVFCLVTTAISQNNEQINWMSWEQLDTTLKERPKPVFIFFYAKWCAYCKKIKRKVFTSKDVINCINKDYYAIEMDVESKDTIVFDGVTFINSQTKTKRNGVHELPLLLASRKGQTFSLPAMLIFDKNFRVKARIFEYYTSKQLLNTL